MIQRPPGSIADALKAQNVSEETLTAARSAAAKLEAAASDLLFSADDPVGQEGFSAFLSRVAQLKGKTS